MDTENFTPNETRKTLRCAAIWLIAVISVWKMFAVLEIVLK